MRRLASFTAMTAIAAALAAAPAHGAQWPGPYASVGDWQVSPVRPGHCSAAREYPSRTRVSVSVAESGYQGLSVLNRNWDLRAAGNHRLTLVSGGKQQEIPSLPDGIGMGGLMLTVGPDALRQLAGGGMLQVDGPDGTPLERLDFAGLAEALLMLPECLASAAVPANFPPVAPPPPPPPPKKGTPSPARPVTPVALLLSVDDYPAAALRAEEQGAVGFSLDVDASGRVMACTVTSSSGFSILDSTTCRLMTMRARFRPARDSDGGPTADRAIGRIVWRIEKPPEPEPTAPPPPS